MSRPLARERCAYKWYRVIYCFIERLVVERVIARFFVGIGAVALTTTATLAFHLRPLLESGER
jgi:hypothetical protein